MSNQWDRMQNEIDRLYGLPDSELEVEARNAYEVRINFVRPKSWIGLEFPSRWDLIEDELRDRKLFEILYSIDPELMEGGSVKLSDRVQLALEPKPRCHDCADHNGRCPYTKELCNPHDAAAEIAEEVRKLEEYAYTARPDLGFDDNR
jgi:hypothetical protein